MSINWRVVLRKPGIQPVRTTWTDKDKALKLAHTYVGLWSGEVWIEPDSIAEGHSWEQIA